MKKKDVHQRCLRAKTQKPSKNQAVKMIRLPLRVMPKTKAQGQMASQANSIKHLEKS